MTAPNRYVVSRSPRNGFTVIELLVVCAVLAVLIYIALPVVAGGRVAAQRAQCASNMRQIGAAILTYAAERGGQLPVSSHTTGNARRKVNGEWVYNIEQSWIYTIAPYLADVDAVRICPADEDDRKERILALPGTSYILNDIVFDERDYQHLLRIPSPASTPIVFISNRPVSKTWDHAHCRSWNVWQALCADVAVDRHRSGKRDANFLNGSSNYLYADGHVESLTAQDIKQRLSTGETPWVPGREE